MKFIDVDAIEMGEDGKPKLDDVINGLKESDAYLFKPEEDGTPNPSIFATGNPAGNPSGLLTRFKRLLIATANRKGD